MPKFLNISDLRTYSPKDQYYFLDANVWIFALNDFSGPNDIQQHYSEIFFKLFEESKIKPKVLICSLLISEIINTYMRVVAMNKLRVKVYDGKLPEKFDFKRDYRHGHKHHYKENLEIIADNISTLLNKDKIIKIIDDNGHHMLLERRVVESCPVNLDFNDYYYYQLLKSMKLSSRLSIITHDSDWKIEDVEIITVEKNLLNLRFYI